MKKILKSIAIAFLTIHLVLMAQIAVAHAAEGGDPIEKILEIGNPTGLPDFYSNSNVHPDAPNNYTEPGVATVSSPLLFALDLFRYLVSGIAFIVIVIAAIKLISIANEEEAGKTRQNLIAGVMGLIVIQLADVMVKKVFFGDSGEAFSNQSMAQEFGKEGLTVIRGIIGFVEVFIGAIAVLTLVIRGFTLLTAAGEEEALSKAKTHVLYALTGIGVIALSEIVVRGVVFPDAGSSLPDVGRGRYIMIEVANFLSGFIAILCFATLFYAGYRYVVAAGNEEANDKVKKVFIGALIGLVLSLGAYAFVNTLVEFEPQTPEETAQTSPEIIPETTP